MINLLTPIEKLDRNAWINAYIILPNGISQKFPDYVFSLTFNSNNSMANIISLCKKLYNCVCAKTIDASAYDILCTLAKDTDFVVKNRDSFSPHSTHKSRHIDYELACKYFIDWTNEIGIIWNDELLSSQGAEELKKTYLGQIITMSKMFKSQQYNNATKARTNAPSQGIKGQPKNAYKSTGSQLNNAVGLLSTPGQKENVPKTIYKIVADQIGANIPAIFVKPVDNPAHGFHARANANNELIIRASSGNGYTDLPCYFTDYDSAKVYLQKFLASGKGNKFNNWTIKPVLARKSGYYKFKTEFGPVYLGAEKLNEQLGIVEGSEILQEAPEEFEEDYNFKIDNPIEFAEIMMKYE